MFVLAILLWIAMFGFAGAAVLTTRTLLWSGTAVLALVLGLAFFAWSGIKSVPSKSIGIPVSLGQVEGGYYTPGAHWTWDPFLHLAIIDETIQSTTFQPGGDPNWGGDLPGTAQCNGELPIRIGGQQGACARITIQWRVKPGAGSSLYSDYANHGDLMETIEQSLVIRSLEVVVNNQVGEYDPITDYKNVVGTNSSNSQFNSFGPAILAAMQKDIGSQILVQKVLFPRITYSTVIEDKLQQIQQAYANYAVAQENILVNQANAQAFAKLGNPTVNQLIAQCLNDSRENKTSPMGCFPGQSSGLVLGR